MRVCQRSVSDGSWLECVYSGVAWMRLQKELRSLRGLCQVIMPLTAALLALGLALGLVLPTGPVAAPAQGDRCASCIAWWYGVREPCCCHCIALQFQVLHGS